MAEFALKNNKVDCKGMQYVRGNNFEVNGSCKILSPKKGNFTFSSRGRIE